MKEIYIIIGLSFFLSFFIFVIILYITNIRSKELLPKLFEYKNRLEKIETLDEFNILYLEVTCTNFNWVFPYVSMIYAELVLLMLVKYLYLKKMKLENKIQQIYNHHDYFCNQKYNKKLPYSYHLKHVVSVAESFLYLIDETEHEDVLIAAAGHDLMED